MKIKLTNFRCYSDREFDFGDDGLTLLSGPSGIGKSSILMAIYFALFGTGMKVASYGKTACKVELTFDDVVITRTKRPNRLLIETPSGDHEDAAAQAIINERFGDTFNVTGYVSQNASGSFIMMGPTEKLGFLERFAFQNVNLKDLKVRSKSLIRETHDALISVTAQLDVICGVTSELVKPDKVKFPQNATKNETIKEKNCQTRIKVATKKARKLRDELSSLQVLTAATTAKTESMELIASKLEALEEQREEAVYIGDEQLDSLKAQLRYILANKEVIDLEQRHKQDAKKLDEMKRDEQSERQTEIEQLESELWNEYENDDDLIEQIGEQQEMLDDIEELARLRARLKRIDIAATADNTLVQHRDAVTKLTKKEALFRALELQQNVYQCPSCEAALRFQDDELHLSDESYAVEDINEVETEVRDMRKQIKRLERVIQTQVDAKKQHDELTDAVDAIENAYADELPEHDEIVSQLDDMKSYQRTQRANEARLASLQDAGYSRAITKFEKGVKLLEEKIQLIGERSCDDIGELNEEELRAKINAQKRTKETS